MVPHEPQKAIILFDGICNFCNYWVNFILDRDSRNRYVFASLQSEEGQFLLEKCNYTGEQLSTLVLIERGELYTRSEAALRIARGLGGLVGMVYIFIIVPRFLRDAVYNLVARSRYRFFGKRNTCRIPDAEERSRFITSKEEAESALQ